MWVSGRGEERFFEGRWSGGVSHLGARAAAEEEAACIEAEEEAAAGGEAASRRAARLDADCGGPEAERQRIKAEEEAPDEQQRV